MTTWKQAGFHPVSHLVWTKPYPSKTGYTVGHHEVAYLLAKGRPPKPAEPPPDVNPWKDTHNRLHPTQKSVAGGRSADAVQLHGGSEDKGTGCIKPLRWDSEGFCTNLCRPPHRGLRGIKARMNNVHSVHL
jgi:hypothetical protein